MAIKQLVYTGSAVKELKVYSTMRNRIMTAIAAYAADQTAHANAVKPLAGANAKRLRVGQFRVVFEETATVIIITKIGPRGNVYQGS